MKTKYALYEYSTTNIGDEIQSIAARRFLPKVDYYIDRDKVGGWKNKNKDEQVKLICNGWYMSNPFQWPIKDQSISPLLVSMFIYTKVRDVFSSRQSIDYLNNNAPVGARDMGTEKYLNSIGVNTYFSACLTLTLQKDHNIKKQDYILAVTVSDNVYNEIKKRTNRPVLRFDTHAFYSDRDEKFRLAEKFLYLYQSAHCVVTTRLHAMLPCLAFETPVLHINDAGSVKMDDASRYAGLSGLTNNLTEEEFLQSPDKYDIENPLKNPRKYKKIRAKLIETCKKFTGYDNDKTFARSIDFSKFDFAECLDIILYNQDREILNAIRQKDEAEISYIKQVNDLQYKLLAEIRRKSILTLLRTAPARSIKVAKDQLLAYQGLKYSLFRRIRNMKKQPIKVFWYNAESNFGDQIMPDLIRKLFGYEVKWSPIKDCDLIGAGSLLGIADGKDNYVWGSGFISEGLNTNNNLRYCAVRGKTTRNRIDKKWRNIPLGDPGLLMNLVYPSTGSKTDKIGVVPHYVDKNHRLINEMRDDERFIVLDVENDGPKKIAEQVSRCRLVLSSSLHGLIFADSFNVPNIHVKLSDKVVGGSYKFLDYYSSIGKKYRIADNAKILNDKYLNDIINNYTPVKNLKTIQRELIEAFPFK